LFGLALKKNKVTGDWKEHSEARDMTICARTPSPEHDALKKKKKKNEKIRSKNSSVKTRDEGGTDPEGGPNIETGGTTYEKKKRRLKICPAKEC